MRRLSYSEPAPGARGEAAYVGHHQRSALPECISRNVTASALSQEGEQPNHRRRRPLVYSKPRWSGRLVEVRVPTPHRSR